MSVGTLIRSREDKIIDSIVYTISMAILLIVAYPLIYIVSASVSEPRLITLGEVYLWPRNFSLEGYGKIFEYKPIWIGYRNTLFYTTLGTCINVILTLTCAYA
jgi:putative aldouronate transport system permease protein